MTEIDALISGKPMPPERIHNWQNSQLSIARHYGGCSYNGSSYLIAYNEEGQPLVRDDVIKREAKAARAKRKDEKQAALTAQGVI
jgi:hypothetical protein